MSIKKIMHKDRHGAQVSIEFGEGGAASQLVEQFLGGMGVPAMQDIPQQHPGGPKGTDTVPAWLTPGEFVMNAEATRMFEPQIEEMNNAGRAVQRQQGGSIPEYKADGGGVGEYDLVTQALELGVTPEDLRQLLKNQSPQYQDATRVTRNIPVGGNMTVDLTGTDYRNLLERTEGSVPISALVQGGLDVGNNISAGLKRAGTYLGGTNAPLSDATLAVDAANRAKTGYDPVAAREEQAKLEAANRIRIAKAEEEYNRDKRLPPSVRGDNLTQDEFLAKIPGSKSIIDALAAIPGYVPSLFKAPPPSYYGDPQGTNDIGMLENKDEIQAKIDRDRASLETELIEGTGTGGLLSRGVKDIQSDIEDVNERQRRLDSSLERSSQKKITDAEGELKAKQQRVQDLRVAGLNERADALEAGIAVSESEEPKDDDPTISGLIDAGNKAKEVKTPEGEGVDETKEPSAWDKVKDFFKEGFGTILDKGALSEAATLYLGSRALGYGHEGSLNFVAKRYGKGIEDKLAIANKAVGKYTPESITKFKDTGNLNDLALIKTLTYTNETEYWIDPKTGIRLDLRVAEDEMGKKVLVDRENNAIDTKNLLKADEYNKRLSTDEDRMTPIFKSKLAKFELENDMAQGEGQTVFNIPEATQAITQYAMKNNLHTTEMNKLADYIFQSVIQGKKDLNNKGISDRNLTELAITDGIVRQLNKDIFVKPDGNRVPATTSDQVLSTLDMLKGRTAVMKGEMLKAAYEHGYMARPKEDRERFERLATGDNNGFLEYLKLREHVVDKDKWVPKYKELRL